MNEYVAALRKYMAENPPNYGSDAHSILEMLFTYYHEYKRAISLDYNLRDQNMPQRPFLLRGIPNRKPG